MNIDHKEFRELCYKVYNQLNKKEKYKGIFCPLNGGFYLAHFLSRKLNLHIEYLRIQSYKGKEQQKTFKIGSIPSLENGKYLLCEDIIDTGRTIEKVESLYRNIEFDICALVSKKEFFKNAVYGKFCDPDEWVEYWWEVI